MYNKAAEWNMYNGHNPGAQVKKPVIQNARDRWLTFEESETLLMELKRNPQIKTEYKELKDPKLHDMALLSLHTGARAGEIFKIKGFDVNFETKLITLRDTKNTETRHCPMTEDVTKMFERRMPKNLNSYVFTDSEGDKIKEVSNAFERIVNRLKMNDGVTDRRRRVLFHSLRHTFASWLAIEGTPLYTISKLMGHKSISMSERYSHLSPNYKKDIVIGLEQMFNRKKAAAPAEDQQGEEVTIIEKKKIQSKPVKKKKKPVTKTMIRKKKTASPALPQNKENLLSEAPSKGSAVVAD